MCVELRPSLKLGGVCSRGGVVASIAQDPPIAMTSTPHTRPDDPSKHPPNPTKASSPLPHLPNAPNPSIPRPPSSSIPSLSPSNRNRISPSPPPLPSKPPPRSRPSLTSLTTQPRGGDEEAAKKAKTGDAGRTESVSPRPRLRPQGVGRLVMGGEEEGEEGEECEIVTTVVVKEEKVEEKRMQIRSARDGGAEGEEDEEAGEGEGEGEGEEAEPGEGEAEESRRPAVPKLGLRLGLGLSGFEETKEDSDAPAITVYAEEAKSGEGRPKLTLTSSSGSTHHTPRLALSLPTSSSSRPTTPQKGVGGLTLHADEGSPAAAAVDSSFIITTTTTTTTTTTSTTQHMRLLPLVPTHHPTSSPFIPSKASNLSTTQSTSSRAAKLDYFLHDCTEITPDLFISGQIVASDSALLHRHGITHIVNACGAVCDNMFPGEFAYYRLYLQDKGSEDVLCILYDVFAFIRGAREKGGKTLIHCQQGVSRSTVLGIGYLMMAPDDSDGGWTFADYQTAYSRVRSKRGISSPNLGFVCQLLAWSRRLLGRCQMSSSLYRFAVHNAHDSRIVNRWMDALDSTAFDSRFILMQSPHAFFVWVGEDVSAEREEATLPVVAKVIRNLQRFEFGVQRVVKIRRGKAGGEGERGEVVTEVGEELGLTAEERTEVDVRRAEIRAHAAAQEEEEEEEAEVEGGGPEGGGEGGGGEEGDTDRLRERANRTHHFDSARPADFFYAVMGGRPEPHPTNAAFSDDFAVETQQLSASGGDAQDKQQQPPATGRRTSRSSLSSSLSSSSSTSRVSVVSSSVQKMQISPTLAGQQHRGSAPSLSASPRSRGQSGGKDGPPLPVNPPMLAGVARRKMSREGREGEVAK